MTFQQWLEVLVKPSPHARCAKGSSLVSHRRCSSVGTPLSWVYQPEADCLIQKWSSRDFQHMLGNSRLVARGLSSCPAAGL